MCFSTKGGFGTRGEMRFGIGPGGDVLAGTGDGCVGVWATMGDVVGQPWGDVLGKTGGDEPLNRGRDVHWDPRAKMCLLIQGEKFFGTHGEMFFWAQGSMCCGTRAEMGVVQGRCNLGPGSPPAAGLLFPSA